MAHLEAIGRDQPRRTAGRSWTDSRGAAVVLLLAVVAIAALGEVVASSTARMVSGSPSSSWQAVLRIGDEARLRGDAPAARRAYLTALFRARGEHSLRGVVAAAEGFRDLGDLEVVEHALRIASGIGGPADDPDGELARRLRALIDRSQASDAHRSTLQPHSR
jgi:hypothetical protein